MMYKIGVIAVSISFFCPLAAESFVQPKQKKVKTAVLKQETLDIFKELHTLLTRMVRSLGTSSAHTKGTLEAVARVMNDQKSTFVQTFVKK